MKGVISWPCDDDLLALYEDDEFTLEEIAAGIGCSAMSVSRTVARILRDGTSDVSRKNPVANKLASMSDGDIQDVLDKCTEIKWHMVADMVGVSRNARNYAHIRDRISRMAHRRSL